VAEGRRERKIVTVVFADLVGFTSRAETLDPEDVEAILTPYHDRLRTELERHGGTVEKFIGDAVMAVFGAPTVHEDDAERAVRAALAIRDAIVDDGTLEVRIGVNTGEALVNLDARPESGKGMVAGDVVNTGARLQTAAPTNGVLVGEATYRATQGAIDYREHEAVEAKGKAEPVPTWEAVEARSRVEVEVQAPRAPLVGRERELDALLDALERARRERAAQLVTLVGEPGIGKSRLVYELFRSVEADPELIWWRHGRSLPYGEGVSFWALGQMVKAQAGILATDAPEQTRHKLRAAVEGMDDADWLVSHLSALVGLGGDSSSGADSRDEAFTAWRRFFEDLAEQHLLVLVFEDLHWADDGLLDFVDYLVDWASGVPILVVGSARPELLERRPNWGGGKRNAATISLSRLGDEDTARLLAALLERAVLPAETQQALLQRAGGNPLYTEEFARMLAEHGEQTQLPETLQGVIASRLDLLATEEKALLQDAAVLGRVFWLGALGAMNGLSERDLAQRLHRLERKEFLRRERRSSLEGDNEYIFLHVLVRDVAYGQIPRADRAEKHERAARWLQSLGRSEDTAEMLAHHYVEALEYLRASGRDTAAIAPAARRALTAAGERAFALSVFAGAAAYFERALELCAPEDPERPPLLVRHAHAFFTHRQAEAAPRLLRTHAELTELGQRECAAEVGGLLAWAQWQRGEMEPALATLRAAVAALEDAPPSRAKAVVLFELARIRSTAGSGDAIELAERAIEVAKAADARDLEARALNTRGVARVSLGDLDGVADVKDSLNLAEQIGAKLDMTRAYLNLASLASLTGDLVKGREYALLGYETGLRWGQAGATRWFRGEETEWMYEFGDWSGALARANEFLGEVEAGSPHYLEAPIRGRRSLVQLGFGKEREALADDERAVELGHAVGDNQVLQPLLAGSAFLRVQLSDRATANERLSEYLPLWRGHQLCAPEATIAFAAAELGRGEELHSAMQGLAQTRWSAAAELVLEGDFAAAADAYREIGTQPSEAYARLLAGDDANVRRALEFYRSVGATFYIKRAEALLPASA
jgi:class 3 adenylate cyclase